MSVLLEVLGRGLDRETRDLLRPFYWQCIDDSADSGVSLAGEAGVHLSMGLAHWREGNMEQAAGYLEALSHMEPNCPVTHAALACIHDEQRRFDEAMTDLRELNRLRPDVAEIQLAMGLCSEKLHQPVSAAMHYRRVLELDPRRTQASFRLAAVALQAGNLDEAITRYEHLISEVPEDRWLRTSLAALLHRAGRYPEAVVQFETCIAMEPENWALDEDTLGPFVGREDIVEAIEEIEESIEQQGPFADLYLRLATLHSLAGNDDEAVQSYHQALDLQPGYLEALVKLATHHLVFHRLEESAETFGRAAEYNEHLLVNYIGLGVSQASTGDTKEAANSFNLASAVEPNSTLLHAQMIRLHWRVFLRENPDDPEAALADDPDRGALACHAERVMRSGDDPELRFHYGVLLRSIGRFPEATREFLQSLQDCPTYLPCLAKLSVMLKEQQRDQESARVFLRVIQAEDDQIACHYRLAVEYLRGADFEDMAAILPGEPETALARQQVALGLVGMGLLDRYAATWRSLRQTHAVLG